MRRIQPPSAPVVQATPRLGAKLFVSVLYALVSFVSIS